MASRVFLHPQRCEKFQTWKIPHVSVRGKMRNGFIWGKIDVNIINE